MKTFPRPAEPKVLLIGPPNVGKSALFNQLTALNVSVGNYTGTTVEYAVSDIELRGQTVELIDVPGTYTLQSSNEAEKVAVDMLNSGPDAVICVLDAGNLEPGIDLLLQILAYRIPTIAVFNRWDLLAKRGRSLDLKGLGRELGIIAHPTVATAGEGLGQLKENLAALLTAASVPASALDLETESRWQKVDELLNRYLSPAVHAGPGSSWSTKLVSPWPGVFLAVLIISAVFAVVIGLGMGARNFVLLPLFRGFLIPIVETIVAAVVPAGFVQRVLIGEYGFLIKGIEWPFTLVLPYVFSFYLALSFLEDTGYLPRLGVLMDGLLQKIGLQGSSIIPLLLGYGCGIPGILATRAMGSHKERLLISVMICLAVPCISQTGAFISLLGAHSWSLVAATFAVSVAALIGAGLVLDRVLAGKRTFTLVEIPELLLPRPKILGKKVWNRLRSYVFDGAVPMFWAIAAAALLYESGIMEAWGNAMRPVVVHWLRLPEAASVPLVLGILRRELTVLPLVDMNLSSLQLFTGAVVALFYVPCIAMIGTLSREFNLATGLAILAVTTGMAVFVGGIIARVGIFLPL